MEKENNHGRTKRKKRSLPVGSIGIHPGLGHNDQPGHRSLRVGRPRAHSNRRIGGGPGGPAGRIQLERYRNRHAQRHHQLAAGHRHLGHYRHPHRRLDFERRGTDPALLRLENPAPQDLFTGNLDHLFDHLTGHRHLLGDCGNHRHRPDRHRIGTGLPAAHRCRGGAFGGLFRRQDVAPVRHHQPGAGHGGHRPVYPYQAHDLHHRGQYAITLAIEIALGFFYGGGEANLEAVNQILAGIDAQFAVNPLLLLPPVVVMVLAFRKIPAVPGITIGIIVAAVLGMIFQKNGFGDLLSAAYGGYTSNSGVEAVDNLLTKGGFESMMYTVSLVICAMMFGGIMEKTNQLRVVVTVILKKAQSTGSLITATVLTAIGSNLILCDQYMSIVMTGKMYAQAYKDQGLHPKNLSRAIEDSATVTANLVPWNSGGAYMAATLGVATIAYLPFNFFCWISPIVSMLFGWFNITIAPIDADDAEADTEAAGAKSPA